MTFDQLADTYQRHVYAQQVDPPVDVSEVTELLGYDEQVVSNDVDVNDGFLASGVLKKFGQ